MILTSPCGAAALAIRILTAVNQLLVKNILI